MRLGPLGFSLVLAIGFVACAPSAREAESPRRERGEERTRSADDRQTEGCERCLDADDGGRFTRSMAASRSETRVIGAHAEAAARPARRHLVDVDLRGARTSDALQFLADAGGFNLVMSGDLAAPVTLKLTRVDAFDALVALAGSQGLGVEYEGRIVEVGAARSTSER